MHRIDTDGNVANKFTDGNPQAGQPATIVDAAWLNAMQEAIIDVIEFASILPVKGDDTQLRDAIIALIAGVVGTGGGSVPTTRLVNAAGLAAGGGALAADITITVPKASSAEVLTGTNDTKAVTPLALANARPRSLSGSGYITLDGGFIIQWIAGTVTGNATTNLSWPTAFPTACFGAICDGGRLAFDSSDNPPFVSGVGTTTVSIFNDINSTTGVFVIGVGK